MRFASLSSGSNGNCSYIGTEKTHILLDCGAGIRTIESGLKSVHLELSDLDAIFITHEHIDHIKALGAILRKVPIPVYASLGTLQGILLCKALKEFPKELLHPILTDACFPVQDLQVIPFSISHDTREPVAYRVEEGEKHFAIATDLGNFDAYTVNHLKDLDVLLLEANHDIAMLENGPYPYDLKRRILSDYGHLSNERSGELLEAVYGKKLKKVLLGHLSAENNTEELALETVKKHLSSTSLSLTVAKRGGLSEIIEW